MSLEAEWRDCIADLGIPTATLVTASEYDIGRRVYFDKSIIYKIDLRDFVTTSDLRRQDLSGEYGLLMLCQGRYGTPIVLGYKETVSCKCLMMKYFDGESLANQKKRKLTLIEYLRLVRAVVEMSIIGIAHNDIKSENILLSKNGNVCLIDFDQAKIVPAGWAFLINLFGINMSNNIMFGSCISVAKSEIQKRMSAKMIRAIKRITGRQKAEERLPDIPADVSHELQAMYDAWDIAQVSGASAPGTQLAYYSLEFGGYHFPGERPWSVRWGYLRSITNYNGMRILELGCNMGLLSSTLLKEAGASAAKGVDVDEDVLRAAQLVASALAVPTEFQAINFDSAEAWEDILEDFKPNLVFALNVLNWVKDKKRFMKFLGRFSEVIFEGHDAPDIEMERLRSVGFSEVVMVTLSERGRPVIYAKKGNLR